MMEGATTLWKQAGQDVTVDTEPMPGDHVKVTIRVWSDAYNFTESHAVLGRDGALTLSDALRAAVTGR